MFQKPGFNMFINADDNQKVPETNAKTSFATPMILDRSPGKSTYADYMTVVDSVENLETPEFIARNSTPAAKKHVMPSKATPATITGTHRGNSDFLIFWHVICLQTQNCRRRLAMKLQTSLKSWLKARSWSHRPSRGVKQGVKAHKLPISNNTSSKMKNFQVFFCIPAAGKII